MEKEVGYVPGWISIWEEPLPLPHVLTSSPLLVPLSYWSELSVTYSFFNKPCSLPPEIICIPLTCVGIFFPILLPFPLPQSFYLVDFNFLTVSAEHHFLRELFPKLLSSCKYHYKNVPFGRLIRFMFFSMTIYLRLSYLLEWRLKRSWRSALYPQPIET